MEEDNQTSKFLSECNLSLLQLRLFTSDYYKYPTCTSQSTLCFPIICQKYLQYSHQFNVLDMHIALSTKRMSHHVRYKNKYQFLHRERNEQKEPLCHNAYAKITNASILICRYTWVQGVACATSRSFFWKKWLSLKKGGGGRWIYSRMKWMMMEWIGYLVSLNIFLWMHQLPINCNAFESFLAILSS